MLKKSLSLLLAVCMVAFVFAGCGKKVDTSKEVTLKWILFNAEQQDADVVAASNSALILCCKAGVH